MGATLPPGGMRWLPQAHGGGQHHRRSRPPGEGGGPPVAQANPVMVKGAPGRPAPLRC
ncbi:hypothetical protein HMPREF9057_02057 [Actinomyces sp. oral taxon 171 str. F0337]|nr:hypothetical protein HMPREF9057_02057 [Actinomyces sp. oral taxon 171 str. F0337]